ncbi:MAG: multiheme c-type cytochrome [Planctomycetaceae bacterium]
MARTLASVADATPIEIVTDKLAEFEAQGCQYRVERIGDRMVHTESMTSPSGNLIYEQSVDVQYAVGSGMNARTYLIDRGGILFESPVTWYTEKKRWDLSPGYHDNPRQRFNRRITDGCIQCHSGRPAPIGTGTSDRFESPPFHELGIGCERCHGPGKRHVEMMSGDDPGSSDASSLDMRIVNPTRLDRRGEDSVCYQCHMGGKGRILRKGKSYHDFQPGMATEEIWTVFVAPTPFAEDGSPRFTSHVEQMQASACFRGDSDQMRCTTCHDPHQVPGADEAAAWYRAKCNNCHADRGCSLPIAEREAAPAFDSCIHCHMPKFGSSDIPHTSGSDHRILKNPLGSPVEADQANQHSVWSIFDGSDQRMPEWEVARARALALSDQAMEESDLPLMKQAVAALEAVLAHDPDDVDVLSKLCFFYCDTRNYTQAVAAFEAALRIDPYHEMSLKNYGMVALQTGSFETGRRCFESYLKVNEWDGTMYGPYAAILANSGNLQKAAEVAERGLLLDPTQKKLYALAAQLYRRIGDRDKSQRLREKLEEISRLLDPWDQKRIQRKQQLLRDSLQRTP